MNAEVLIWSDPPADKDRLAVFAVAFVAMAIGWFGFGQPLFGLLGFAMILGSTADYWLGTSFRLDAQGASAHIGPSVTAMEWSEVKRILVKGNELRLSPLESPSALDAFRGVGLSLPPKICDEILAFVDDHLSGVPKMSESGGS